MSYLIHYYYLIHHGIFFANNYGSISKSIFLGLSKLESVFQDLQQVCTKVASKLRHVHIMQ